MSILLIIVFVIVAAIIAFVVYRRVKVSRQNIELNNIRLERIKPLVDKIKNNEDVNSKEVMEYASNILTRCYTYDVLKEYNKEDLFPKEFYSFERASESFLANWLEFPTELGMCPDKIEFVKRSTIDFDGNNVYYDVFKFMTNAPHWASNLGWSLGVVGPYFDDSEPYHHPGATFSRLGNESNGISPDEEAKWVHENISFRRF